MTGAEAKVVLGDIDAVILSRGRKHHKIVKSQKNLTIKLVSCNQ